ncbi:MAG TPA: anti-sigma factor [Micromonosporaceae bacterium]|jgi:anti-sigma-K factor RskA
MSEEIHTLAGAYALDAVNDVERVAFARHLAGCESCAQEVSELQAAAVRLADATWSAPPRRMRTAVLARAARTRQEAPGTRARDRAARAGGQQRWRRWTAAAVAAGIIAIGGAAASYAIQEQRVRDERAAADAARAEAAAIQDVLRAPDATLRRQRASTSGTVTVVDAPSRGAAVVLLDALPAPGADKAYQLWLGHGGAMTSAGVLAAGQTTALIPRLDDADAVGVSLEPAGGSPRPTDVVGLIELT